MPSMITKAAKIFVEPDEEIVFTVEKIVKDENHRIILVVPHTAALTSSAVSLKILGRQIAKSDKLVVLVSDNPLASNLGEKAGLVVLNKISEVGKDAWANAKEYKDKLTSLKDKIRDELLDARNEKVDLVSDKHVSATVLEDEPAKAEDAKPETEEAQGMVTEPETAIINGKQRLKGKVIDINNIKLFAGGDILEHAELLDLERSRLNADEEADLEANTPVNMDFNTTKNSFVGRDLTKLAGEEKIKTPGIGKKIVLPVFVTNILDKLTQGSTIRNIIIGFIALVLVFMIVSYFFFVSVAINITLATTTSPVTKTINAATDATETKVDTLTMPATIITKSLTQSGDVDATGKSSKGDAAFGDVTIYNKTSGAVTIGTDKIFSYYNGTKTLTYKPVSAVTVAAAVGTTPGQGTVTIKATAIGAEYNIADTSKTFTIQGYDPISQVDAVNFHPIAGGTSTDTITVSADDLKGLEESLTDQLKTQLLASIRNLVSSDDILLDGTEKFKKDSFTATAKEGDEVKDNKFSGELKMTATAVIIKKADLKTLVAGVVRLQTSSNDLAQIDVRDPLIQNIKIVSDTKTSFDIETLASISAGFNTDDLKEQIKGKGVDEAKAFLSSQAGVEEVRVKYNPPYIPQAIQKLPGDVTKFTITVNKSTN